MDKATVAILPTALFAGGSGEPHANQDNIFLVPYSDHSSYEGVWYFVISSTLIIFSTLSICQQ